MIELRDRLDTNQLISNIKINAIKLPPFQSVVMFVEFDAFTELSFEPLWKFKIILIFSFD